MTISLQIIGAAKVSHRILSKSTYFGKVEQKEMSFSVSLELNGGG